MLPFCWSNANANTSVANFVYLERADSFKQKEKFSRGSDKVDFLQLWLPGRMGI